MINSKRRYLITGISNGIELTPFSYLLKEILDHDNNSELAYALQDNIDAILNLELNRATVMHCNRDNKTDMNLIIVYRNQ